jgi:hypothetical protein
MAKWLIYFLVNVPKTKYFGVTATNKNLFQEEIV